MPTRMKFAALLLILAGLVSSPARADNAAELNAEAKTALEDLYAKSAKAKELAGTAQAVLVFPKIVKGGFIVAGQYGKGVLMKGGEPVGYYSSTAGSYGLQAGVQKFGYALVLMTPKAVAQLDSADGWELGAGPSLTVVDEGVAKSLTTRTAKDDVYAFTFDQKGLMGGLGLQGTKITKLQSP